MPHIAAHWPSVFAVAFLVAPAQGIEWPDTFAELDSLLRTHSPKYKAMADEVRRRQPYEIVASDKFPLGNVKDGERGGLAIELNPRIERHRRATCLIWEMANAYQRPTFAEITRRAKTGEIASAREYGIRMELVEHGSHQLHRDILEDLSRAGFNVGEDFLYFLNPKLKSLSAYRIPSAHSYIDAMEKSGHTMHYEDWYYRVTGKTRPQH